MSDEVKPEQEEPRPEEKKAPPGMKKLSLGGYQPDQKILDDFADGCRGNPPRRDQK